MKAIYTKPIKTVDDAIAFFHALHEEGKLFHPEDDAAEIVNFDEGMDRPIFTTAEAEVMNQRTAEAYELKWFPENEFTNFECPCDLILTIDPPRMPEDEDEWKAYNAKTKELTDWNATRKEQTK